MMNAHAWAMTPPTTSRDGVERTVITAPPSSAWSATTAAETYRTG